MISNQIKPDYSADIAKFVANGGEIKTAVNTNKAEFNYCNADTVCKVLKDRIAIKMLFYASVRKIVV